MKIFLLLILPLISSVGVQAQNQPLFTIVCASEGVKVDGNEISIGQDIYSQSEILLIPAKGYVGVITREGIACMLDRSVNVEDVLSISSRKRNKFMASPSGHSPIQWIPSSSKNREVVGDTIVSIFTDSYNSTGPYIAKVINVSDELIQTDTVYRNWHVFDLRKIMSRDSIVVIDIVFATPGRSNGGGLNHIILKPRIVPKLLAYDLGRIPVEDPDADVIRMAIFELRSYWYDNFFYEYKWMRDKRNAKGITAKNYMTNQIKKNSLDLIDFGKK